jgi:hypothetical protein
MWHVWGRKEGCTGWGNLRERGHWGDPDVDGRIILTLCSRVVNLIKYPLMPEQFKFFEVSTPNCTVTYILTL